MEPQRGAHRPHGVVASMCMAHQGVGVSRASIGPETPAQAAGAVCPCAIGRTDRRVKAPPAPSSSREAAGVYGSGLARPVSSSISTPAAPAARCSSQALASGCALFAGSGLRPWCNPISGCAQIHPSTHRSFDPSINPLIDPSIIHPCIHRSQFFIITRMCSVTSRQGYHSLD